MDEQWSEVLVKIDGETHYLWRAVDHEGEVLESDVTKARDKKAALKFLKKSMKRYGRPEPIVIDWLRSHGAALMENGAADRQETGRWLNNRAEGDSHPVFVETGSNLSDSILSGPSSVPPRQFLQRPVGLIANDTAQRKLGLGNTPPPSKGAGRQNLVNRHSRHRLGQNNPLRGDG